MDAAHKKVALRAINYGLYVLTARDGDECRVTDTIARGDHTIFVGRVESFSEAPGVAPLLFHAGQYRALIED